MKIDAICDITKDRKQVVFDSGDNVVLYKGELRLLKLKEGAEITEEQYRHIVDVILVKRAKIRSLNLLKTRAYTEYQLRKKLKDGLYPASVIDAAVEYVKSYGYVNDRQYASDYISEQKSRLSKRELFQKLVQKGIDKDVIEAELGKQYDSFDDINESFDERTVIEKLLAKRGFTGNESYEERQKLLAYFYRRGFNMDAVFKAMDLHNNAD